MTAIEELATAGAVAALYTGPTVQVSRAILRYGTPDQISTWGRPLVQGKALGAWAFTEPATGSDPKQIKTRAVRDGNGWILNGAKMFTSFAAQAQIALVFAKTSEDRLGAFIVETARAGWRPGKPIEMMAFGGQGTAPVVIEDLWIPDSCLLGPADGGFDVMRAGESEAKVRAGAICIGIGRRALEESVRYASERLHRGIPIGDKFPTVRSLIGEMSANVDGARALVYAAASAIDAGRPVHRLAASVRIVAARMAREVTGSALEVCGAYGLTRDMVLERLYREGKFYEVGQGVIELQRIIVGKLRMSEFAASGSLDRDLA